MSPLSFYFSAKQEWTRRLRHDGNWAMQYPLEMMSSPISIRSSVVQPHHTYVSMLRQPCANRKAFKNIHKIAYSLCTYFSVNFLELARLE